MYIHMLQTILWYSTDCKLPYTITIRAAVPVVFESPAGSSTTSTTSQWHACKSTYGQPTPDLRLKRANTC